MPDTPSIEPRKATKPPSLAMVGLSASSNCSCGLRDNSVAGPKAARAPEGSAAQTGSITHKANTTSVRLISRPPEYALRHDCRPCLAPERRSCTDLVARTDVKLSCAHSPATHHRGRSVWDSPRHQTQSP